MKKLLLLFLLFSTIAFGQEKKIKKAIDYIEKNEFNEGINLINEYHAKNPTSPLWSYATYLIYSNPKYPKYELEAAFNYLQYVYNWTKENSYEKDWCKSFNLCVDKLPMQLDSIALIALAKVEENRTENKYILFLENFKNTLATQKGLDSYHRWKYELALEKQSIEAIQQFIKEYPNSFILPIAKQKIEELEFKLCAESKDISKMQAFIRNYPNSNKSKELSEKIIEVEYKNCEDKNDVTCFENFLKKYPDSKYVSLISKKIEEIEYDNVKKQSTKDSYDTFLKKHPNSNYTEEIKKKLDELVNGVIITTQGQGKTSEEAKHIALRNAIEQAFGTFISSKTEIFNDEIVANQMSSVSSGNIKSYEILNESQLPNGTWASTLRVIVSIDKLTSFVESKGITVEIKGGLFALNIKQQLLNEQGEINAITNMFGILHETMQTAFDYSIKSGDPKSMDAESKNWEIPLTVIATANKNMDFCANYCIKILSELSLSTEEVTSYKSLSKAVLPFNIKYNGGVETIFLRKQNSIDLIRSFGSNWGFFTRLFTVQSGMDESNGKGESKFIHSFLHKEWGYSKESFVYEINFLTSGQQAATFSLQDKRTLSQIEQINEYTIKPRNVVSPFKLGGFIVFEENGHGLVAAITDLGKMDWNAAKTACEELIVNGYSDWYLPSKDELILLYENLKKMDIGGFTEDARDAYWSSTEDTMVSTYGGEYFAWYFYFYYGDAISTHRDDANYVRAVRAF